MIVRHVSKCIFLITISAQTCWSCTVPCIYPSHIETVSDLNERGNMSSGKLNVAAATRRQGTLCGDLYGQAVAGTSSIGCSHFSTCEGSKWDGQHWNELDHVEEEGLWWGEKKLHWLIDSLTLHFLHWSVCQFCQWYLSISVNGQWLPRTSPGFGTRRSMQRCLQLYRRRLWQWL